MNRPRVVAIVGATATGKTALGEALAKALGGEIVCADSRQVYRELEIGTGKPTPGERRVLGHHLFEALALGDRASAGWYARAAREACAEIHTRGRIPVLVGGSGLYLRAARAGLSPTPPESPAVRERLRGECAALGVAALHRRLCRDDPETAARLDVGDAQRVMRALEVLEASTRPLSWWHRQPSAPAVAGEWCTIEITLAPRALAERIARRTRAMLEGGLVEETARLVAAGRREALQALRAIGYDEALEVVDGRATRDAAAGRIDLRTRQLAKRQRTWFRHQIEAVRFDGGMAERALRDAVLELACAAGEASRGGAAIDRAEPTD